MQQLLAAHDLPSRVLYIGVGIYCGQRSQAVLQVLSQDRSALLLLSPPKKD